MAARKNFVRLSRGRIWQPVMGTGPPGKGVGDKRNTRAPGRPSYRNRSRFRRRFLWRLRWCPRLARGRCVRRSRSLMIGVSPTLIRNTKTVQGGTRERLCGVNPLVKATLSANPEIGVKALRKTVQQETGVSVSVITAARARCNILLTDATEIAVHDLPEYFQALFDASYRECFSLTPCA